MSSPVKFVIFVLLETTEALIEIARKSCFGESGKSASVAIETNVSH